MQDASHKVQEAGHATKDAAIDFKENVSYNRLRPRRDAQLTCCRQHRAILEPLIKRYELRAERVCGPVCRHRRRWRRRRQKLTRRPGTHRRSLRRELHAHRAALSLQGQSFVALSLHASLL